MQKKRQLQTFLRYTSGMSSFCSIFLNSILSFIIKNVRFILTPIKKNCRNCKTPPPYYYVAFLSTNFGCIILSINKLASFCFVIRVEARRICSPDFFSYYSNNKEWQLVCLLWCAGYWFPNIYHFQIFLLQNLIKPINATAVLCYSYF